MTDDERLARLTELARSEWPEHADVRIYADGRGHASVTYADSPTSRARLVMVDHPRALDALEAALLVLADEARIPLTADQVTRDALESCRRDREALVRRIREERAAMEQLAGQWASHGAKRLEACITDDIGNTLEVCAAELRTRAKLR